MPRSRRRSMMLPNAQAPQTGGCSVSPLAAAAMPGPDCLVSQLKRGISSYVNSRAATVLFESWRPVP